VILDESSPAGLDGCVANEDWQNLLREASDLRSAGRTEDAIAAYQRLLSANPQLPDSWYNLGWLQRRARSFEAALESYQKALDLNIAGAEEVHLNRAVIFSDCLHRPEDAARELRTALEVKPDYVPALLNLGNLMEDLGDRGAAKDAYARAHDAEPDNSLALARLANVSQAPELDSELAERLRHAINRSRALERADLGFALAGLLDAAGQYDMAIEAAEDANRSSGEAAGVRYDRASAEDFIDRLIAAFDAPSAHDDAHQSPLFICGMFRSGSTLIEQILGAHSKVEALGELDLVPALVQRIADYPQAAAEADAATVSNWRSFYLDGLPVQPTGDRRVTDKRPDNFLHIGLIKRLFPSARIIHTRRNPLDNLISLYLLHLNPAMAYALDLEDSAHWYRQHDRLMAHWKSLYREDIFEVDYDALVSEPQPIINRLLSFLGLEWEDQLLDFHARRSTVKTASVWQVRQPLHSGRSGRWRNYAHLLDELDELRGLSGGA
jgi:tetratricopeptide (TPR) repeat protein